MESDQRDRIRQRIAIGERRIRNILRSHGVATMRMLEQKISDAGPNPQRIDPHLLTQARTNLTGQGILATRVGNRAQWHYLNSSDKEFVERRFADLTAIHAHTENRAFTDRMGDTAEISVMKAMQRSRISFFGHFADLHEHDDGERYLKHDPDFFSGVAIQGKTRLHPRASASRRNGHRG